MNTLEKSTENKKQAKTFQIHAKKLFLTYAQTTVTPKEAFDQLTMALMPNEISSYFIAQEKHEDGNDHLHCFIEMTKKQRIRDAKKLELKGSNGKTFKGNYQPCRNKESTQSYIAKELKKDSLWVADERITKILSLTGKLKSLEENMMELAEGGHIEAAMQLYREVQPKKYIRDHMSMRKSLKSLALQAAGLLPVDLS